MESVSGLEIGAKGMANGKSRGKMEDTRLLLRDEMGVAARTRKIEIFLTPCRVVEPESVAIQKESRLQLFMA